MRPMKRQRFLAGTLVVTLASLVGITLGHAIARVAFAKDRPGVKRARQSGVAVQAATPPCPTITFSPLTLTAEDSSTNEGLTAPGHGGKDSAIVYFNVSGLPNNVRADAVFTFQLYYRQDSITRTDPYPPFSSSMALSGVSVFLGGAGRNFLNQGDNLTSRGGSTRHSPGALPLGTLRFTAPVSNGRPFIQAGVQASAISSFDAAHAAAFITLDLVDISFAAGTSTSSATKQSGVKFNGFFNLCPTDCNKEIQAINQRVNDIVDRYMDMLNDSQNLYCLAREVKVPGLKGTWRGHQEQYVNYQNGLKQMITDVQEKLCIVPQEALVWATKPPPDRPSNPKCP